MATVSLLRHLIAMPGGSLACLGNRHNYIEGLSLACRSPISAFVPSFHHHALSFQLYTNCSPGFECIRTDLYH
ncbi:hypothetical protein GALMADRAFT_470569 [Galerina marginata CBS 339.88]|uniref:Uncharacterized protein n=1 Tax=Galerina marginata (strain CBS 339.88) TaxID=685588 RepID=A0A067T8L3_GALM3|nr:hypothetical protein GALMADRAFT_470569 [Galerina marginata CBS 339.88]